VLEATTEAFVPQMANLQLVDGVSFTKGCYTGQEVVARMQYLGTLKRRMYRVRVDSDSRPAAGTELFSASSASGQGAGRVVDARPSPDGGFEALVVCQIASMEAGDLRLGDAEGPALQAQPLPYAFEATEQAH
jgi:folate-binding protein YgfZ